MKVLHLSSEKSWRGGEQQIAYLIEELDKLGVKSFVAARKDSEFLNWCTLKGIPSTSLSFKNDFDLTSALALKRYCAEEKFDLIHLHSSRGHGIAFLSALLGNKTPLILSRRVDFHLKTNWLSRAKYNHPSIKRIICVSDKIKEIVSQTVKHTERCVTIYDGVDLNRFAGKGTRGMIRKELGIGGNELLIGNIAALAPHKDYFTFLETAKILEEGKKDEGRVTSGKPPTSHVPSPQSIRFLIAGDGPLKTEIEKRIGDLDLTNKVYLLGFRKDLENVYADLDVLLYTSKEEGLGSSLLDAMAYGLPIVATEAGGIPEIVINERTGLTAPVHDSKRLAAQVERLLNDTALRNKLIVNAKEFVKKFSKEVMAKKTLDVYREVIHD